MLPSLHSSVDEGIKPAELNLHLSHVWWKDAPLLADDFYRSCMGTDLNWQVLTVYWQVRNNFGRNRIKDTFGFEWGGSPEEEAINATIHVQEIKTLKDLPGDESFWGTFQIVWDRWERWKEVVKKKGQDLPAPKPPKPNPTPKPPTPAPQEPPKPAPVPKGGDGFKKALVWVGGIVTLLGVASFFVPALAPLHAALKALLAVLQSIQF